MINKKAVKTYDDGPINNYYDTRLGYTISKHCKANKIWKQSGKFIQGAIGSPESLAYFKDLFSPQADDETDSIHAKRICYLANRFCAIEDMAFREIIINAKEEDVYWNGESFQVFQLLYDEYMKFFDDKDAYKEQITTRVHSIISNDQSDSNKQQNKKEREPVSRVGTISLDQAFPDKNFSKHSSQEQNLHEEDYDPHELNEMYEMSKQCNFNR
jgi:hypothetical protein